MSKTIKTNPVAKYGKQFNRCVAYRDRTKYQRKPKHKPTYV